MKRRHCSALLAAMLSKEVFPMNETRSQTDLVEHASRANFADTLERLTRSIESAGMRIFCRIDHAAAAAEVGLSMPPTTVLIYGSPKGGTPVMLATPSAALDLPLRVLVREEAGGRVMVAFNPITLTLGRLGVPPSVAHRLEPAQRLLLDAV